MVVQGMKTCFRLLFGHVFNYIFNADVILSHVIGVSLVLALQRQGLVKKQAVALYAVEEMISYLLWLALPDSGFDSIVSIWIFLSIYERIVGPRFIIHENAILRSDDKRVAKLLAELQGIDPELDNTKDELRIKTDLKIVVFHRTLWLNQINHQSKAVSLEDVSSVEEGCKPDVLRRFRSRGIEGRQCLTLSCNGEKSLEFVLIASDEKVRDRWLAACNRILGIGVADVRSAWLDKLLPEAFPNPAELSVSFDRALAFLENAGRPMNRKYAHELYKKFTPNDFKMKFFECNLKLDGFRAFFTYAVHRPDISEVYERYRGKSYLNSSQFHEFVVNEQKENVATSVTRQWIKTYEPVLNCLHMSSVGFTSYLLSEEHSIWRRECRHVYQDMTHPLSHYYIATSHNTYLTKDQLKSKSQVEAYVNALKRGCKCVELDIWDGTNNEPVIYHGYTLTSKILVKDVLRAIKEYAFCVSRYPVILSFENHCSIEQQRTVAQYINDILGDLVYSKPVSETDKCLPSPASLEGCILVKAKKLKEEFDFESLDEDLIDEDDIFADDFKTMGVTDDNFNSPPKSFDVVSLKSENDEDEFTSSDAIRERNMKTLSSLEEAMEVIKKSVRPSKEKSKTERIAKELSDLVVYCQPSHFKGFENAKENSKYYEMVSFSEKRAFKLAKEDPTGMLEFNNRQLSRIYPAGGRIDSSNYDPVTMWNVGCQLVALNYQTACQEMQLNQALFQDNGRCGYVLKPEFMRQEHVTVDPRKSSENFFETLKIRVNNFVVNCCYPMLYKTLNIMKHCSQTVHFHEMHNRLNTEFALQIIGGHEIPFKNEKILKCERQLCVQVRIVGADIDSQCSKTKIVKNNGFNPFWNEDLTFKIHVPDLAFVIFTVLTKEVFTATSAIPYRCMQKGYRRVPLMNKFSEPDPHSHLFVNISVTPSNSPDD